MKRTYSTLISLKNFLLCEIEFFFFSQKRQKFWLSYLATLYSLLENCYVVLTCKILITVATIVASQIMMNVDLNLRITWMVRVNIVNLSYFMFWTAKSRYCVIWKKKLYAISWVDSQVMHWTDLDLMPINCAEFDGTVCRLLSVSLIFIIMNFEVILTYLCKFLLISDFSGKQFHSVCLKISFTLLWYKILIVLNSTFTIFSDGKIERNTLW